MRPTVAVGLSLIETLFQRRANPPPRAGTGAAPEDASYTLSFTKSYTTWAELLLHSLRCLSLAFQ